MTAARRHLIGIGAPTFGLALSVTAASTYLPLLARGFGASAGTIGLLLAAQGVTLACLSIAVGRLSDRAGSRRDYLCAGSVIGALALTLTALSGSEALMITGALLFFLGYVLAYEPYRALILDVVPADRVASAHGVQGAWRVAGTAGALVIGGVLAGVSLRAPLLCAAGCLLVSGVTGRAMLPIRRVVTHHGAPALRQVLGGSRALRRSLIVAGLAELSQAVVRAFSLLYATETLHSSATTASLIVAGSVVVSIVAAVAGGTAARRCGPRRVVLAGGVLLAMGLAGIPASGSRFALLVPAIVAVAAGGGVISALSYALGAQEIPAALRGALTGATSAARGVGMTLGPLLGGAAVTAAGDSAAFWVACAATALMLGALGREPAGPSASTGSTLTRSDQGQSPKQRIDDA